MVPHLRVKTKALKSHTRTYIIYSSALQEKSNITNLYNFDVALIITLKRKIILINSTEYIKNIITSPCKPI